MLQARLDPFAQTISRREISYLFDAYTTLVRATHEVAADTVWQAQVRANGGLIISIDGIQPDKGNETVYLVRDVLTGRVLAAENVRVSDTETIKRLLAPVVALKLPVLGAVSDAQESLCQAIAALWPDVPHQLCQFHYLREAAKPIFEADRHAKVLLKKEVRGVRPIERALESREDEEATAIRGYCLAVRSALTDDGRPPLCASGLKLRDRLEAIGASLGRLEEKGAGRPS